MKFELIKKVPVVEIDGRTCFLDTGYPYAVGSLDPRVQQFFGISGLHVAGVQSLKRYTKFDYPNCEITTSDDPISLEGGETVPLEVRPMGWLVKMTVGGVEGMRYIDTGAAFSYVHNISTEFPSAGIADECSFDGRPWTAPMRRVPCEFAGHPFEILCGDARDNKANPNGCAVPPEGVIGYDFFANFTLVVDSVSGKMTFVKN
jgi:hypothetical protein